MPGVVVCARLRRLCVSWRATPRYRTLPLGPRKFRFCPAVDPRARKCRGGPAGPWGRLGRCRPQSGELPSRCGLSPVALTVPAHPGSPPDPVPSPGSCPWPASLGGASRIAAEIDPGTLAVSGGQLERQTPKPGFQDPRKGAHHIGVPEQPLDHLGTGGQVVEFLPALSERLLTVKSEVPGSAGPG